MIGCIVVLVVASGYLGAMAHWWAGVEWQEQTSCASCLRPVWQCRCGDAAREAVGQRLSKPGESRAV